MPDGIDPILGIFVAQMGPIAANGILHADAEIFGEDVRRLGEGLAGRPVVVFGGGTVGLLTALVCAKGRARKSCLPNHLTCRRKKAEALGLDGDDGEPSLAARQGALAHGGQDRGADFVFQTRAHG